MSIDILCDWGERTQLHAEKAHQAKLRIHPFARLPWALGTMGQHLIPQTLEDE